MSHNDDFSNDILQPMSFDECKKIIDWFGQDIPTTLQPSNILKMFLDTLYILNDPDELVRSQIQSDRYRVKLYKHCDGRLENCTIVTISERKDYRVYAASRDPVELEECLRQTKRINFNWNPMFFAFEYNHMAGLKSMMLDQNLEMIMDRPNTKYFMHKEVAAKLVNDIPDNLYLDYVRPEDVDIVYDLYPLKDGDIYGYIMTMLRRKYALGLFLKGSNEIVAWIFINEHYALGLLQTKEEHKRKGYASMLVKALARKVACEHNRHVFASTVSTNIASGKMFKKLGFQQYGFSTDTIISYKTS